jgi:hypothetical protein
MAKNKFAFRSRLPIGDVNPFVQHLSNNITKETIIQRITFVGKIVLKMYFNEFFSNEFVYFQFKHGFNRVYYFQK